MPTQRHSSEKQAKTDALGSSRVLQAALVLAVLVHIGLLLVHFTRPEVERRPVIEITLDAPEAERSLDAGQRTDSEALDLPADPTLASLAGQESPSDTLRENGRGPQHEGAGQESPSDTLRENGRGPQHEGAGGASDMPRHLSTQDRIDRLYEQVNSALRTGYATSRTQGGPAGRYLARWKRQVEVYGNQNYPNALVRQNLSGRVILEVTIGKKGHVLNLAIRRSSGSAVVDNAARNLLQAAAPYPPFPAELAAEHDRLVITRTWVFTSDRRLRNEAPTSP